MNANEKETRLPNTGAWALLFPPKERLVALQKKLRTSQYGYVHLLVRWVSPSDGAAWEEEALFVPRLARAAVMTLGEDGGQSAIVKEGTVCEELFLCEYTDGDGTPRRVGEVGKRFVLSDGECLTKEEVRALLTARNDAPSGGFDLAEVLEVEAPRASYFGKGARYQTL